MRQDARRPAASRPWFAAVALLAFASVVVALASQHAFGMEPCAWCVLQRLIFVGVGIAAVSGLALTGVAGRTVAAGVAMLLADLGIVAAAWQQLAAAKSASCNLTLADRIMNATGLPSLLPDVFEARASCADAAVNLVGIPYAWWSAGALVVCSVMATLAMLASMRRTRSR